MSCDYGRSVSNICFDFKSYAMWCYSIDYRAIAIWSEFYRAWLMGCAVRRYEMAARNVGVIQRNVVCSTSFWLDRRQMIGSMKAHDSYVINGSSVGRFRYFYRCFFCSKPFPSSSTKWNLLMLSYRSDKVQCLSKCSSIISLRHIFRTVFFSTFPDFYCHVFIWLIDSSPSMRTATKSNRKKNPVEIKAFSAVVKISQA